MLKTPQRTTNSILKFCKEINSNAKPIWVECMPSPHAEENECFYTVNSQIAKSGGNIIFGWDITWCEDIMIDAEFHAIWEKPDKTLLDISIHETSVSKRLFLPDQNTKHTGDRVPSIRKALIHDKNVVQLINIANKIDMLISQPDCEEKTRKLHLYRQEQKNIMSVLFVQYPQIRDSFLKA